MWIHHLFLTLMGWRICLPKIDIDFRDDPDQANHRLSGFQLLDRVGETGGIRVCGFPVCVETTRGGRRRQWCRRYRWGGGGVRTLAHVRGRFAVCI